MMKKNTLIILCLGIALFLTQAAIAQQTTPEIIAQIEQYFTKYGENTPAASVTISQNGQTLYQNQFGMADLEHLRPANEQTLFEAGSVSKQFTAAALLLLVREGKVSLDDPVQKYIPELPHYERPITLRHLVHHTSGLKDWGSLAGLGGWARGTRVYTNDIALQYIIRQPDLNHLPGDEYIYSNSNYTLMTLIVERVSGQSLAEFTSERFFKPLGMKQTRWRTNYKDIVPGRATGYAASGNAYAMNMPFENTYGHAALLTTTEDLDIWNTSWYGPEVDTVLRALRETQGILTNGDTISYAGGVRIDYQNGRKVVNHSGATAGYRAWLAYIPEENLSIAVLSSDAQFVTTGTGRGLAAIFIGDDAAPARTTSSTPPTYTPDPQELAQWEGSYYSDATEGLWHVQLEKGRLKVRIHPHQRAITLRPIAPHRFQGSGIGEVTFSQAENGESAHLSVDIDRARHVIYKRL